MSSCDRYKTVSNCRQQRFSSGKRKGQERCLWNPATELCQAPRAQGVARKAHSKLKNTLKFRSPRKSPKKANANREHVVLQWWKKMPVTADEYQQMPFNQQMGVMMTTIATVMEMAGAITTQIDEGKVVTLFLDPERDLDELVRAGLLKGFKEAEEDGKILIDEKAGPEGLLAITFGRP